MQTEIKIDRRTLLSIEGDSLRIRNGDTFLLTIEDLRKASELFDTLERMLYDESEWCATKDKKIIDLEIKIDELEEIIEEMENGVGICKE